MNTNFEIIPNEILLNIFSYLSWIEILESFWSLNERFNSIVCSSFLMNKNGIILNRPGISYKKLSSILFPLINNSLQFSSSIKHIHIDGENSLFYDTICEYILSNNDNKQNMKFLNLKSLYINQCFLSQSLSETLCFLIQNQLEELRLSFDKDLFETDGLLRFKADQTGE